MVRNCDPGVMTSATFQGEAVQAGEGVLLHAAGGGPKCRAFVNHGLTLSVPEAWLMLPRWLMALLVLLREGWSARRDAQVRFLKLQIRRVRVMDGRIAMWPYEKSE